MPQSDHIKRLTLYYHVDEGSQIVKIHSYIETFVIKITSILFVKCTSKLRTKLYIKMWKSQFSNKVNGISLK